MDERTLAFYEGHADVVAQRYEAVASPVEHLCALSFPPGARALDLGCGSGRDTARLLAHGYEAYGVEPSEGLRSAAIACHRELQGRLAGGALPNIGLPFGGSFDAVLCSAVLMPEHISKSEVAK